MCVCVCVCLSLQGLNPPALANRLSEWQFESKTLRLTPDPPPDLLHSWRDGPFSSLTTQQYAAAIQSALRQLQTLQAVGQPTVLLNFDTYTKHAACHSSGRAQPTTAAATG